MTDLAGGNRLGVDTFLGDCRPDDGHRSEILRVDHAIAGVLLATDNPPRLGLTTWLGGGATPPAA